MFNVFFVVVIHAVLVRFSEDPDTLRDLAHLEEDLGEDEMEVDPLACVRRPVQCVLYAGDAGLVSKTQLRTPRAATR